MLFTTHYRQKRPMPSSLKMVSYVLYCLFLFLFLDNYIIYIYILYKASSFSVWDSFLLYWGFTTSSRSSIKIVYTSSFPGVGTLISQSRALCVWLCRNFFSVNRILINKIIKVLPKPEEALRKKASHFPDSLLHQGSFYPRFIAFIAANRPSKDRHQ